VSLPPLVLLVGPTAVGKTEAALALAERLQAEIVSADSRLLYRGLDIGTAKPTPEEQQRVRHHLVDVADPGDVWSLAQVRRAVLQAADDITGRGRLPLVVGGTGQYIRALLEGWEPPAGGGPPSAKRLSLEDEARRQGGEALHGRLRMVDPASAERIDARNVRRVIRALEIFELTGAPASTQRRRVPLPYRILCLGLWLPRAELYARIDARLDDMLRAGWVEEVRGLLAAGLDPAAPAFSAIGYPQLVEVVSGRLGLDEAKADIRKRTRAFVRRQANWFKPGDPGIRWFENRQGVIEQMEREIRAWLAVATV
jgi:tRNA dimethylallyltransferase